MPATVPTQFIVYGLVQGVYYRASTVQQARRLGLAGWVRNRRDGTVEARVAGDADAVQELIGWARRGPPNARVERVEIGDAPDAGDLPTPFEQRETV